VKRGTDSLLSTACSQVAGASVVRNGSRSNKQRPECREGKRPRQVSRDEKRKKKSNGGDAEQPRSLTKYKNSTVFANKGGYSETEESTITLALKKKELAVN